MHQMCQKTTKTILDDSMKTTICKSVKGPTHQVDVEVDVTKSQKNMCIDSNAIIDVESYKATAEFEVQSKFWIAYLNLTQDDRNIMLSSNAWLSDTIVNAAQQLLKSRFVITGLQNVLLGQTHSFAVELGEFVQILHTGCGHWHVISTIGTKHAEVNIFDSMYSSYHSKTQIASILATKEPAIKLKYIDVQMQSGQSDCGIFAIAFATALAHGLQPVNHIFQQNAMRNHLLNCLENGKMTMFPIKKVRRTAEKVKKIETIPVYCSCRMPELPNVNCIQCYACKEWFHIDMCVKVDKAFLNKTKLKWYCSLCS